MKQSTFLIISILLLLLLNACSEPTICNAPPTQSFTIDPTEVSPWCILEFDSLDRTPTQRITMLKELGIKKYGYNWRERHLPEMQEEFRLAKINNIEITSTLIYLNPSRDSLGKLSPRVQYLLKNLKAVDYKPTIWVTFSNNFFKKLSQKESIEFATEMIKFVKTQTDEVGCPLALYNHKGWFGNPHHQVEILEKINDPSIKMVFNFHHGHDYIDEFPKIVKMIKPYLHQVNLNGMKKGEDTLIKTIGKGDHELAMIQTLVDEGFNGPWGILGHIKEDDVQKVLERNISGLNAINSGGKILVKH